MPRVGGRPEFPGLRRLTGRRLENILLPSIERQSELPRSLAYVDFSLDAP